MVVGTDGRTGEHRGESVALGRSSTDEGLISQALTSRYPAMRRLAAVAADTDIEPDDVVHEVFARVFVRWHEVGVPAEPDAYLRRAIMNHIRNERRARARGRSAVTRVGATASAEAADPTYPSDLDALLDSLTPEDRSLVFLVDIEGLSARDAAAAVGLTAVAARSRLSRARRALRTTVAAQEREERS